MINLATLIVLVIAFSEALKRALSLESKVMPLVALGLSIVISFLVELFGIGSFEIIGAIVNGLVSMGFYDLVVKPFNK